LSSLLHILIVTPVIFVWLREREARATGAVDPDGAGVKAAASERGPV
jgi:hypothetical protein